MADPLFYQKTLHADGRSFLIMIIRFDNGNFVSVSEGATRLGSMTVSLRSGPGQATTEVIPARTDPLFLRLVAERTSSLSGGIAVVSSSLQGGITPDTAKALMAEIAEMVRNV